MNPYEGANSFLTRPNVVPGVPKKSVALREGEWDPNGTLVNGVDYGAVNNVAAWVNPSTNAANPWTFGTAAPTDGSARRFPYLNEDISIIKRTKINERVNIEFRGDFLNIFNRTLFGFDQGGDQYGSILQGNQVASGLGGFGHVSAQSNFPREIQPRPRNCCASPIKISGTETVNTCLARGKGCSGGRFWSGVDLNSRRGGSEPGLQPQGLETRAFSVQYFKEAPKIPPCRAPRQRSRVDPHLPLIQGFAGIALIVPRGGPPPPLLRFRGPRQR